MSDISQTWLGVLDSSRSSPNLTAHRFPLTEGIHKRRALAKTVGRHLEVEAPGECWERGHEIKT